MFKADIDAFLAPISPSEPSGRWLRYESTYDNIQEARREDADVEQGVWKTDVKKADWNAVEDLCSEALKTSSKDLQIAAWLTEAWIHNYGFEGAREGIRLLIALCEEFWDTLYPAVEDGDLDFRLAPMLWLNEKLSKTVEQIAVTAPKGGQSQPYSWAEWQHILYLENIGKKNPEALKGAPEHLVRPKFQNSCLLTARTTFEQMESVIGDILERITALDTLLTDKCGNDAPSFKQFSGVFESIRRFSKEQLAERHGEAPPAAISTEDAIADSGEWTNSPTPESDNPFLAPSGSIRNRAEAYRRLLEVAEYLQKVEPHSPTPYLVKRAVAWGNMSLPELLQELVNSQSERDMIFGLLQIPKQQ